MLALLYQEKEEKQNIILLVSPLTCISREWQQKATGLGLLQQYPDGDNEFALRDRTRIVQVGSGHCFSPGFSTFLNHFGRLVTDVVQDEVHMLVTEHEYRPELAHLGELLQKLKHSRFIGLTGTASKPLLDKIKPVLCVNRELEVVRYSTVRNDLIYKRCILESGSALASCVQKIILERVNKGKMLVFLPTVVLCEEFADKFKGLAYHAKQTRNEQNDSVEKFQKGSTDVMFCTTIAVAGFDPRNVKTVVLTFIPEWIEVFLQAGGRGNRDESSSKAFFIFLVPKDELEQRSALIQKFMLSTTCILNSLREIVGDETSLSKCDTCSVCGFSEAIVNKESPSPTETCTTTGVSLDTLQLMLKE